MKNVITIILLVFLIVLGACSKFPEGPKLSFRTVKNRICGNWEITSYTKGGVDSLFALPYKQIEIGEFYKKKYKTPNPLIKRKYILAFVKSYPEGVDIATVRLLDKSELLFYAPMNNDVVSFPNNPSLAWTYFEFPVSNWLGEFDFNRSNYHIQKLEYGYMKIQSYDEAFNLVEYELTKIK